MVRALNQLFRAMEESTESFYKVESTFYYKYTGKRMLVLERKCHRLSFFSNKNREQKKEQKHRTKIENKNRDGFVQNKKRNFFLQTIGFLEHKERRAY